MSGFLWKATVRNGFYLIQKGGRNGLIYKDKKCIKALAFHHHDRSSITRLSPNVGEDKEATMMRVLHRNALILGLCLACCLLLGMGRAHAANANGGKPGWPSGEQTYGKDSEISGNAPIGSAQCSGCHPSAAQSFRRTTHFYGNVECENCHGVGSPHVADETKHGNISTFRKETAKATNDICLLCHYSQTAMHGWASGVHAREGVACVACHRVHTMKVVSNQPQVQNDTCTRCHTRQAAEGNLPYHHPVREAKMTCVDCHNPHGGKGRSNLRASRNELCFKCHAEYQGPFTYQHVPVTEDCMKCHAPHGSMNKGMLQVSQPFLCLQCHAGHHNGSGIPLLNSCTLCHSTIHGTDTPSATGGSIFIDKSVTAPASLSPLTLKGKGTMRAATNIFSYGVPFAEALTMASAIAAAPDKTEYWVQAAPSYRYLSTSGFPSRVGEYDSLKKNSFGGDFAVQVANRANQVSLNARGSMINQDDYNVRGDLRVGNLLSLKVDARSLVHNLENTPFGTNLSPDDITRDNLIPQGSVFGVKKTSLNADARLSIPGTPLTFFMRGGMQSRSGVCPLNFYDMAASQTPGVCDTCHSVSRLQDVNYKTRDLAAGSELKLGLPWAGLGTVTYEHGVRIARNRVSAPVDLFGSALSIPGESLPPGVPDTPAGFYVHNVVPGHRTSSDTLRLNLQWPHSVTVTGDLTYGHTTNSFTSGHQNFINGDATLNWEVTERINLGLDFHEKNTLNEFTPLFALYGNPNLDRLWAGPRGNYKLTDWIDVEAYYRYTQVTRSKEEFWPQFYSPDNMDPLRVVPETNANALGTAVKLHQGSLWKVRLGYEWVHTRDPGYLTDPGIAHRILANGSISPVPWLSLGEDVTVTLQSNFPNISRRNHLYTSTTSLTLKPMSEWSVTVAYAYFRDDLESELIFGVQPFYSQNLVPFYAATHGVVASSNLNLLKQLLWNVDFRYNVSNSKFRPDPAAAPPPPDLSFTSVAFARDFSLIDVPQLAASTGFEYKWRKGFKAGVRGEYAIYHDAVHPELTGRLWGATVYLGMTF